MTAEPDKPVGHVHQRRTGAFQVRREQCQKNKVLRSAEKHPETFQQAFFIQRQAFYKMPAGGCARSAAAFKNSFRCKPAANHMVCFEKFDGQKRNVEDRFHLIRVYSQSIRKLPVNRVVMVLKPEDLECKLPESFFCTEVENVFFYDSGIRHGLKIE